MKSVEIRDQVRLGLAKCVELVFNGLRFRLFRAAITVTIISLAAAFLMTMLTEGLISRRVAAAIETQTRPRELLRYWVSRLSSQLTEPELNDQLAAVAEGSPAWREFCAWGGLDERQMRRVADSAKRAGAYLAFFKSLPESKRRLLVGRSQGLEAFDFLGTLNAAAFGEDVKKTGQTFPGGQKPIEEFAAFLAERRELAPLRKRIIEGHEKAREAFKQEFASQPAQNVLAASEDDLRGKLAKAGFLISEQDLQTVREQADLSIDAEKIARTGQIKIVKTRLAGRLNRNVSDIDVPMLFEEAATADGAKWLADLMADPNAMQEFGSSLDIVKAFNLDAQRVRQVARNKLRENELAKIESGARQIAGEGGFSSRATALIVVSFMVCVVGIANAMLMSVTERFREIATMKCLGATDGFIMINFMLESIMQGLAGGAIGTVLGLLLGLGRAALQYGTIAIGQIPPIDVVQAAAVSLALGVVVSALAAVYPAWVAARLAPMEAMRIE